MNRKISSHLLNFLGTFFAVAFWGILFISLDVSAPQTEFSLLSSILFSSVFSIFFLLSDAALRFTANYLFPKEIFAERKLLKEIWDVFWYSMNGSFSSVFMVFLFILLKGLIEIKFVSVELTASLLFGFLLFIANFTVVFVLRMIAYFIRNVVENYRNQHFLR